MVHKLFVRLLEVNTIHLISSAHTHTYMYTFICNTYIVHSKFDSINSFDISKSYHYYSDKYCSRMQLCLFLRVIIINDVDIHRIKIIIRWNT